MALVPVGRYLVVSPVAVDEGVYVPDLPRRLHELPPSSSPMLIVGHEEDCTMAQAWLEAGGRTVEVVDRPHVGSATELPAWRLWNPHPWILEASVGTGRALDLGCGAGRDAVCLAAAGWEVLAVDNLPDALDRTHDLKSRYAPEACLDTGLSIRDGEFDLITMIRYFDPIFFRSLADRVRPGGAVIVETYSENHRNLTGRPKQANLVLTREIVDSTMGFRVERWETGPVWTRLELHRD